jgi:hypothetical protein
VGAEEEAEIETGRITGGGRDAAARGRNGNGNAIGGREDKKGVRGGKDGKERTARGAATAVRERGMDGSMYVYTEGQGRVVRSR